MNLHFISEAFKSYDTSFCASIRMCTYYREYEAAVQELSICMAFAPEEEAQVLEPFVEKLHLMRLETSWKSLEQKGRLTVP